MNVLDEPICELVIGIWIAARNSIAKYVKINIEVFDVIHWRNDVKLNTCCLEYAGKLGNKIRVASKQNIIRAVVSEVVDVHSATKVRSFAS